MSDKVKKKSIFSTVFLYIYLIGVVGFIFLGPKLNYKRGGGRSWIKACYSNIRVLQGAVEMYNMDVETMMTTLDQSILMERKYIKSSYELVCPERSKGGTYHGDHLTDDGEIICTYHGGLIAKGPYEADKPSLREKRKAEIQEYLKDCLERIPFALAWPLLLVIIVLVSILGAIENIIRF
jgi:hypothetical protein